MRVDSRTVRVIIQLTMFLGKGPLGPFNKAQRLIEYLQYTHFPGENKATPGRVLSWDSRGKGPIPLFQKAEPAHGTSE